MYWEVAPFLPQSHFSTHFQCPSPHTKLQHPIPPSSSWEMAQHAGENSSVFSHWHWDPTMGQKQLPRLHPSTGIICIWAIEVATKPMQINKAKRFRILFKIRFFQVSIFEYVNLKFSKNVFLVLLKLSKFMLVDKT